MDWKDTKSRDNRPHMQLALKIGKEIRTDTFLVGTGFQISLLKKERPNEGKTINTEESGGKIHRNRSINVRTEPVRHTFVSVLQLENIIGMDLIPKLYEEWMPFKRNKNKNICLT